MASLHGHALCCSPSATNSYPGLFSSTLHGGFLQNRPLQSPRPELQCRAKFEKFEGVQADVDDLHNTQRPPVGNALDDREDDDSDLPCDLEDAVRQSSRASAMFLSSGGMRAIVELLIPQLQFLDDEGAQAELWELSRIFLESLREESGFQRIKAIFPDAGATALLKHQWKDATFGFSRLTSHDLDPNRCNHSVVANFQPTFIDLAKSLGLVLVYAGSTTTNFSNSSSHFKVNSGWINMEGEPWEWFTIIECLLHLLCSVLQYQSLFKRAAHRPDLRFFSWHLHSAAHFCFFAGLV